MDRLSKQNGVLLLAATVALSLSGKAAVAASARRSTICPSCSTLKDLGAYLEGIMPGEDSELYVAPSRQVLEDWEAVVGDMMAGSCDDLTLPLSLHGAYAVETFIDRTDSRPYCVLAAVGAGTSAAPWGAVIVNPDRDALPLSIDIPHPLYDANTLYEGMTVLRGTNARSYVLSGSHRHANSEPSPCQPDFGTADAAHNSANTFLSSVSAILDHYGALGTDHTAIQLHGMGAETCPGVDIHLSHGSNAVI